MCPTVVNPRSLAPLGARLLVVTGDHGLGARRVQAVLPALLEATAVVLEDYAGLTWADLAADRGERIDTAMREFLQHRDPLSAVRRRARETRCRRSRLAARTSRPTAAGVAVLEELTHCSVDALAPIRSQVGPGQAGIILENHRRGLGQSG